jgi:hypothetical protein
MPIAPLLSEMSADIPEPTCLGDFVKLLDGPKFLKDPFSAPGLRTRVCKATPQGDTGSSVKAELLRCIQQSMACSPEMWDQAADGELFEYRDEAKWNQVKLPKPFYINDYMVFPVANHDCAIRNALKILNLMHDIVRVKGDFRLYLLTRLRLWKRVKGWLIHQAPHFYLDNLLQAASLVSCGLGISAFDWSKKNVAPVLVEFRGKRHLALAPIAITDYSRFDECEFHLVERKDTFRKERFVLISTSPIPGIGLFPQDVKFEAEVHEKPLSRMKSFKCTIF